MKISDYPEILLASVFLTSFSKKLYSETQNHCSLSYLRQFLFFQAVIIGGKSITLHIFIMTEQQTTGGGKHAYRMSACEILDPDRRLYRTLTTVVFLGKCKMYMADGVIGLV